MRSKGKIAIGIAGAFAAGITLGLLFAPRKGRKTRNRIANTVNGIMDSINEKLSAIRGDEEDVEEKSRSIVA